MSTEIERCAQCGGTRVTESRERDFFLYGPEPNPVMLSTVVPMLTCQDCLIRYTDYRAEDARDVAVQEHLNALGAANAPSY